MENVEEYISNESKHHFEQIKEGLKFYNINYNENHQLVRGLDYYCGTVFEFKTNNLGSQDTLLGGGRYNGLIQILGGPDLPGIGWAAGIERISMLMDKIDDIKSKVHLAVTDEKYKPHLIKIIKYLNDNQINFYWNYKYNLKKSLSKANLNDASCIIIIGENESKNNFYTIKNLNTGNQSELPINKIKNFINDKP